MPKELINGIFALIIGSFLVVACYLWVDKPVAFWVAEHHLRDYRFLIWFTRIPEIFTAIACLLFPYLAVRFCYKKWGNPEKIILTIIGSLAIENFLHTPLKILFGRYWPATWINNNPSLLRDNVYGFNFFRYGSKYASFPSGHTGATVAVMAVIWIFFPRLRWLVVLVVTLVAIGLIGMNYHFVGDVIGGGLLGGLTAYYTAKISQIQPFQAKKVPATTTHTAPLVTRITE